MKIVRSAILLYIFNALICGKQKSPPVITIPAENRFSSSNVMLILTLIFTSVAAAASAWSALEAHRQADAAIDANRAWLKISMSPEDLNSSIISNQPGSFFFSETPKFSARNVGKSPAKQAYAYFIGLTDVLDGLEAEKKVCNNIPNNLRDKQIVFPDEEINESNGIGREGISFDTRRLVKEGKNPAAFTIFIVACATYRYDGSNDLHHSATLFQAWRRTDEIHVTSNFDVSVGVRAANILFIEDHNSGQFAD